MPLMEKDFEACPTAEHVGTADGTQNGAQRDEITVGEEKKIIRKIDMRLITALAIMCSASLIDRTNLAGANIAGLSAQLHLDEGYRYSLVVLIFFIPHILLQWPGVMLVRKLGPRLVLPAMVITWGCVTLSFGFMQNWEQMMLLRVLLGIFEAGLLPGCILLLQVWYRRYDVHKRFSLFYGFSLCLASYSGLLAFGFMQMDGVGGLSGWRYIFIWEGVLTILIGLISALLVVDFPQNAQRSWKFLCERELTHILTILENDRRDIAVEPFDWSQLVTALTDVKIWAFSIIYFTCTVMAYAIAYFAPIILNQKMGFSVGMSQLFSTPPFFIAGVFMYIQGWIGDKFRVRAPFLVWNAVQAICGLSLLTWTNGAKVQYCGLFLLTSAANASIPCAMAYQANNICGQQKRSIASASLVVFGGIGGIVGAVVFRSQDAPTYLPGIYCGLGCCGIQLVVTGLLTLYLRGQNRRAANGDFVLEGVPGFRYTL